MRLSLAKDKVRRNERVGCQRRTTAGDLGCESAAAASLNGSAECRGDLRQFKRLDPQVASRGHARPVEVRRDRATHIIANDDPPYRRTRTNGRCGRTHLDVGLDTSVVAGAYRDRTRCQNGPARSGALDIGPGVTANTVAG